mgnify:CR=1 FL=1
MINITAALNAATTPAARAELNDWAVNTIRANYEAPRAIQAQMLRGEIARVKGKTLAEYLRTNRTGSPYRLNRKTKRAVYVLLATR